jgi:O-antigen/teichoic acid export membrane protein
MILQQLKEKIKASSKVLSNLFWLSLDYLFHLTASFFVGILVIRYLGPEDYGVFSYATALVALAIPIAGIGINRILLRELSLHPENRDSLMGTAFFGQLGAGTLMFIVVMVYALITQASDTLKIAVIGILCFRLILLSFSVIEVLFQSRTEAKYAVWAKNIAILLVSAAKVGLVIIQATLIDFVIAVISGTILSYINLIIMYKIRGYRLTTWRPEKKLLVSFLKSSWPIMFTGLLTVIYTRIDQVMLGDMLNDYYVGIYSVSILLLDAADFIRKAVLTGLFPNFTKLYNKNTIQFFQRYAQLTMVLTWVAIFAYILTFLFADEVIPFVFGEKYIEVPSILIIHMIVLILSYNASLRQMYLIVADKQKLFLIIAAVTMPINIILNFILIPDYKAQGAAYATIITYIIAMLLMNAFIPSLRKVFIIQLKAFLLIPLWELIKARRSQV